MHASFKTLVAAVIIFGGAAATELSTASAQSIPRPIPTGRTGVYGVQYRGVQHWPRSSYAARYHGGYRHYGGYRRAYYGPRYGYYGPRRYGYYGRRYGYYGRYPYRYYRHGYYGGGAVAAGVVGGLALGTLANPYYYGYGPAYYGPRCVLERRRVINRYGHRVWRRVQVCY